MKKMNVASRFAYRSGKLGFALMCALGLGIGAANAQAQDSPYDDYYYSASGSGAANMPVYRLFQTETPYSPEQGTVLLSASGNQNRTSDLRNTQVLGRVDYGITDHLSASVGLPVEIGDQSTGVAASNGISHLQAGAQYSVSPFMAPISMAAAMNVDVPLGSGSGNDAIGARPQSGPMFKPSLSAAMGTGPITTNASVAAELGESTRALDYSVAGVGGFGAWAPSLELTARSPENQRSEYYVTPGVSYSLSDRAQVGVGYSVGIGSAATSSRQNQIQAKFNFHL